MMSTPFDLDNDAAYRLWRDAKRASHPLQAQDLVVDVADPRALTNAERQALLQRCATANMAIYRSPLTNEDKGIPRKLAAQLGLHQLDANWLADEDGISPIAVAPSGGDRPAFIPYTNRGIKWHTDGYYHPGSRHIKAMVLHCVRAASEGGGTALMDHEMAYIALREANPNWVNALMAPDAMTIPARLDDDGVARPEQTGPVFSVDAESAALHMRYTARTRSIEWRADAATRATVMGRTCFACAWIPAWGWCATTCCMTVRPLLTIPGIPDCCTGPAIWIGSMGLHKFSHGPLHRVDGEIGRYPSILMH